YHLIQYNTTCHHPRAPVCFTKRYERSLLARSLMNSDKSENMRLKWLVRAI
ncbi:hypothetical protein L9F63_006892, partial [Diploptera punctata]